MLAAGSATLDRIMWCFAKITPPPTLLARNLLTDRNRSFEVCFSFELIFKSYFFQSGASSAALWWRIIELGVGYCLPWQ